MSQSSHFTTNLFFSLCVSVYLLFPTVLTEPYIPFDVSVSATTSVGAGVPLEVTIFSREGGDIN